MSTLWSLQRINLRRRGNSNKLQMETFKVVVNALRCELKNFGSIFFDNVEWEFCMFNFNAP